MDGGNELVHVAEIGSFFFSPPAVNDLYYISRLHDNVLRCTLIYAGVKHECQEQGLL